MRRLLAATTGVLVLTACGSPALPEPDLSSRVDVDTAELRAAKKQIRVEACPAPTGPGSDLPALTLPCLGGGRDVTLSEVSGPAVIQLWASWCVSCPDELPLFQRLADENDGRITVLGIDWQDTQPGKAMALLELTETTVPQVADPGGDLAEHYRLTGLPGVLLVDRDGDVTFLLRRLDSYGALATLVEKHTGVAVDAR